MHRTQMVFCLRVSGIGEGAHKTLSCLCRFCPWPRQMSATFPRYQFIPAWVKMDVCDIHLLSEPYTMQYNTKHYKTRWSQMAVKTNTDCSNAIQHQNNGCVRNQALRPKPLRMKHAMESLWKMIFQEQSSQSGPDHLCKGNPVETSVMQNTL